MYPFFAEDKIYESYYQGIAEKVFDGDITKINEELRFFDINVNPKKYLLMKYYWEFYKDLDLK